MWIFFVICVCLYQTVMSVSCSLLATLWERAELLAFLYVMSSCVFVTFPFGVLSQMWDLIVSIPDLCLFPYFDHNNMNNSDSLDIENRNTNFDIQNCIKSEF